MKTLAISFALVFCAGAVSAAPVAVTSCGQVVERKGQLTGDLDCSSHEGVSVTVGRGLKMNGFTITGHPDHSVVVCTRTCKIAGPGTITGGRHGVERGVAERTTTRIVGVTIDGNSGLGVTGYKVRIKNSTITNNGSVNGLGFSHTGGVHAVDRVAVRNTSIEDNLNFGLSSGRVILAGTSVAINNGLNPDCATHPTATSLGCVDLAVSNNPHGPFVSRRSLCLTSQQLYVALGLNWGVCQND